MQHLSQHEIIECLEKSPILQSVPIASLQWLVSKSQYHEAPKGNFFFDRDQEVNEMFIILEGKCQIYIYRNQQPFEIGILQAGDITGVLPYSRLKKTVGQSIATEDMKFLSVHKNHFPEMIQHHPELTENLVHLLTSRVRTFTAQQRQDEKIMALGKLSAGLAHELNNPAAVITRSAATLRQHLGHIPEKFKKVIKIDISDEQVDLVNHLMYERIKTYGTVARTLLQRNQLEDELTDWLEDHQIGDCAPELAETFVVFGFTPEDLDLVARHILPKDMPAVLQWIESNLNTERLVREIHEAADRISGLVSSVKSYTHMDRAPKREKCDLRIGIQNTITMLQHKIKRIGVNIIENYPEEMPLAPVYVSEINQVWTNLLDNALDAIKEQTEKNIRIHAFEENNFLKINIEDNGAGIPEEVQSQIFDPFFTTKGIGEGTGLGLDVVRQIMEHHNGKVTFTSQPQKTVFQVCLPLSSP